MEICSAITSSVADIDTSLQSANNFDKDLLTLTLTLTIGIDTKSIFQQITVRLAYQLRWPEHRYETQLKQTYSSHQNLGNIHFQFLECKFAKSKLYVTNFMKNVTCVPLPYLIRLIIIYPPHIIIFLKPSKSFSMA